MDTYATMRLNKETLKGNYSADAAESHTKERKKTQMTRQSNYSAENEQSRANYLKSPSIPGMLFWDAYSFIS